ncbi:hypothetical protein CWI38_0471p0040 [Hamiltosporidium tvaerminnensis]|uniref:Uncharacterized protein n=1 Tax=Hamiltosporidium tvaerminnensis TaxID=1176355 RepID=A0A4Q9LX96_9MICR|nr:hypothetical protein CWI38_0471p0040 [Hamiltosporidium tvaerminnensis]
MTVKELKNIFLTKFPNYDLMMFKNIFFDKADSLIPVLDELKNEIARFVLNEISNDDSIMVNCLVKFFTETKGIAPVRLSSNSWKDDMNLGIVSSDYSGLLYKNLDKLISNNILKRKEKRVCKKKLYSKTDINEQRKTVLLNKFEIDWPSSMGHALIKLMVRFEEQLKYDRLLYLSFEASLLNHPGFLNRIKSNLLLAKTHIATLKSQNHRYMKQDTKKYNSQAVESNRDLTSEELNRRFLTGIQNYDLIHLKKIYYMNEVFPINIFNQLKNKITEFVLSKISKDDSIIVNCFADAFSNTESLIPYGINCGSNGYLSISKLISNDYGEELYRILEAQILQNILNWYESKEFRNLFYDVLRFSIRYLKIDSGNKKENRHEESHSYNIKRI